MLLQNSTQKWSGYDFHGMSLRGGYSSQHPSLNRLSVGPTLALLTSEPLRHRFDNDSASPVGAGGEGVRLLIARGVHVGQVVVTVAGVRGAPATNGGASEKP